MKERIVESLKSIEYSGQAEIAALVEKPGPGIHARRTVVEVQAGSGCTGDHQRKDFWRGKRIPGREVTMFSEEVAGVLGVDPVVVGDNLISRGIDLRSLKAGDLLSIGPVLLRRSEKDHRPCDLFARRVSPEAKEAVLETGNRGALFYVVEGGTISLGEVIKAE